jgi:hypothetical protein
MTNKFFFFLILLGFVLVIGAQTIEQFQIPDVPPVSSNSVKSPAIASNSRGDIMVVFRNKFQSVMYYFKKKANGAVTQVKLPGSVDKSIVWTSVVSTADNNFHAVWGVKEGGIGVFYADFDITSEQWNAPIPLYSEYAEDCHLRVSPLNNDIVLCTVLVSGTSVKNVFVKFRKNGQTNWTDEINITNQTGTTNTPYSQFDEQGYLHVVYNEDWGADLIVRVALIKRGDNGTYSLVDKQWTTSEYTGAHCFPSIAITGNKGIITFMWREKAEYYYLPYERSGDKLVFDQNKVTKIVSAPPLPLGMFVSKAIAHGDEIMYTYFDLQHKLKLLRWKDGQWIDSQPIALENDVINKWPYNIYTDPDIGLLTIWFIEDDYGAGHSSYCIYNYPKSTISSPISIAYAKKLERSLFSSHLFYEVTWQNNPINIAKNVTVVKFNIYRRASGSSGNWVLAGSVAGTVLIFRDKNEITSNSNFEYTVTAVNDKNQESTIQQNGLIQKSRNPDSDLCRIE